MHTYIVFYEFSNGFGSGTKRVKAQTKDEACVLTENQALIPLGQEITSIEAMTPKEIKYKLRKLLAAVDAYKLVV